MVSDAARLDSTPGGIRLCALTEIADPGARNFVIQLRAGRFHGFVVRRGEFVAGYVDRCPHMGLPLAQKLDDYLSPKRDFIACAWHGAIFEIATGRCAGGPCVDQNLLLWPVGLVGDDVHTVGMHPPVSG